MTRRGLPTPAQLALLRAIEANDVGVIVRCKSTVRAAHLAGWIASNGTLSALGRDALRQAQEVRAA